MKPPIKILCVDDNQLVAEAIQRKVLGEERFQWGGWISQTYQLLEHLQHAQPDILLLDIDMPGTDPFEMTQELGQAFPELRVLMFSAYVQTDYIDRAVAAGAWGYISKNESMQDVLDAIERAAAGEFVLTREILDAQQIKA